MRYTMNIIHNILRRKNMIPKVGQFAPVFTLKDHLDRTINLADYRGKRNVVLAFFPLAWTPV
jgi:peroxiredoxin